VLKRLAPLIIRACNFNCYSRECIIIYFSGKNILRARLENCGRRVNNKLSFEKRKINIFFKRIFRSSDPVSIQLYTNQPAGRKTVSNQSINQSIRRGARE
jgi:hypothetical protein